MGWFPLGGVSAVSLSRRSKGVDSQSRLTRTFGAVELVGTSSFGSVGGPCRMTATRTQLLFGPYRVPRLKYRDRAFCLYRDARW